MNKALIEGLSDAIGFVGGVLLAYWLVGMDPRAEGYGGSAIGGIVLAGLGGGVGLQIARRWRAARQPKDE